MTEEDRRTSLSYKDAGVNIDSIYLLHSNAEGLHFAVTVDDPQAARANLGG